MKKFIFILSLLAFTAMVSGAKPASLRAYLSHAAFQSPESGPFIETYLSILGSSVAYTRNDNGKFQGTILVTMLFKQNDSIKEYRKYDLKTAEIEDTTQINFIVFDQQRVPLREGKYDLELQLSDKNREMQPFNAKDIIDITFDNSKISLSDLELVDSYSKASETSLLAKSGYDFIPYQDNY